MKDDRVFFDTNILVYAYDTSAGIKHQKAAEILQDAWNSGNGIISTQVLQEFFVCVTKKMTRPLELKTAKIIVKDMLKWNVVLNDGENILEAIDFQLRYKFSFWDSLIISAALRGNATILYSEDFTNQQKIEDMVIKNIIEVM